MDEARPERRLLKLLAAGVAGLILGVAITVGRILYIAPTPEDELAAALDNNAVFQLAIRQDPSLHQAMRAAPQPRRAALLRVAMGPQP